MKKKTTDPDNPKPFSPAVERVIKENARQFLNEYLAKIGKKGGKVKSAAKTRAARKNAALPRPRKAGK
jgi:hypothetical protein